MKFFNLEFDDDDQVRVSEITSDLLDHDLNHLGTDIYLEYEFLGFGAFVLTSPWIRTIISLKPKRMSQIRYGDNIFPLWYGRIITCIITCMLDI